MFWLSIASPSKGGIEGSWTGLLIGCMPADPREPEFDDEGNILSEGDYGLASSASDASSDEDDATTSSSSSDHNSGDESDMST
ncbi:hypothetical protein GOP47_0013129 [Adiantum capillus-veneris]|uniref:Uncharacterized protein n=1 Tax=Adiantum capillus-veneris TaxID=13818 RepID=A0A9D4UP75_ADICA|nr:hypothetical protein GOP47_0013129 [Adiantum capillus-veneris]